MKKIYPFYTLKKLDVGEKKINYGLLLLIVVYFRRFNILLLLLDINLAMSLLQ